MGTCDYCGKEIPAQEMAIQPAIDSPVSGGYCSVGCVEMAEKRAMRRARANRNRRERDAAMRSLGLKKVRGPVSGKTYWE